MGRFSNQGALVILAAASFLALASCAHPLISKTAPVEPVPAAPKTVYRNAPSPQRPAEETTKAFQPEVTIKEAGEFVSKGEFEKALGSMLAAMQKYPEEPQLAAYYPQLLESVKAGAEKLYTGESYARAGEVYRALLDDYPGPGKKLPSFSREYLSGQIGLCAKNLTDQGLIKYRAGELEGAISVWSGILKFDPLNEPVKKAINTARIQLKSLTTD